VVAHPAAVTSATVDPRITASSRPWLWSQHWLDLLFTHWQAPVELLRPHIPACLQIDTWQGLGYVSIIAFQLERNRHRWLPSPGWAAHFPELNLRTYVVYRGEPAIYFLSIHAGNWLGVRLARWFTPLPYAWARINSCQHNGRFQFDSHCSTATTDLRFSASYTSDPVGREASPGSLDAWLLERYCLYADNARGTLLRTVVQHQPWTFQDVSARITVNTLGCPFGLDLGREPDQVHFSAGLPALVWSFEAVQTRTKKG